MENFSKFGSKRFSMDELAKGLGISKKTLYKQFESKEELVSESLDHYLGKVRHRLDGYMRENPNEGEPLTTIIYIYRQGLTVLQEINPAFLHGLDRFYPKAFERYNQFKRDIVWEVCCPLLKKAQQLGQVRPKVNVELVCLLFLSRFQEAVHSRSDLFEQYALGELLEHLVINNLRGILTLDYLQQDPLDS